MAKKRVPSIADAANTFREVLLRAELTNFFRVNRTLLSTTPKGKTILIVPSQALWNHLSEDKDLKDRIKEPDLTNPEQYSYQLVFQYAEDIESEGWIDIDAEKFYKGEILKITVSDFTYQVSLSKDHLPLKLKKSEFNDIQYRIYLKPSIILGIKKKFITKNVPDGDFYMMNFYQVI